MKMSRFIYDHVAVIGIDGMGNFNRNAKTPNIDSIFADGATNYFALSMNPTISAENWGAMLLGANPMAHRLTNSIVSTNEYDNKELPSLFTRLRRAFPGAYLSSVVNWKPINHGIIEHDVGAQLLSNSKDEDLTPVILEEVAKKPKFLFVQFDDVDGAGHKGGYGLEGHLNRISITDEYVGKIHKAYEDAGILDKTLFIVTADHGGIRRGHGGYTDEEKYVFFGASGKSVKKGEAGTMQTKDISALVLYALGVEVPAYNIYGFSSQVPEGIFEEPVGEYIKYERKESVIETLPTPAYKNGLAKFVDPERLKLAVFFDNEIKDETGNCEFEEFGKAKYYSNGVRSSCGEFGTIGCVRTSGLAPEIKGSFTVAAWVKVEKSINEECVVFSTKPWWWRKRSSRGFSLVMKKQDSVFCIANGDDDFSVVTPFPEDFSDGWIHILCAVDKDKKEIGIYYNFRFIRSVVLPDEFCRETVSNVLVIGNDSEMDNNNRAFPNLFRMDDFLFFEGTNEKDADALKLYYGM